jgi:hypothetical protein
MGADAHRRGRLGRRASPQAHTSARMVLLVTEPLLDVDVVDEMV